MGQIMLIIVIAWGYLTMHKVSSRPVSPSMRVGTFPEGTGGSGHRPLRLSPSVVIFRSGVLVSKCAEDFLFGVELPAFFEMVSK